MPGFEWLLILCGSLYCGGGNIPSPHPVLVSEQQCRATVKLYRRMANGGNYPRAFCVSPTGEISDSAAKEGA